jgi:hypothetical protein
MTPGRIDMKAVHVLFAAGALLLAGVLFAGDIAVDSDTTADFSLYKTYAWKAGTPAPNPGTDARIVSSVEKELAAKGLKKVDKDPDLWVSYQVVLKKEATITDWDYGKFKFQGRDVTIQKLARGSLAVDLIDGKLGKLLWRGVATEYISPDAPPEAGVIEKAVALLFKGYPPKKEG